MRPSTLSGRVCAVLVWALVALCAGVNVDAAWADDDAGSMGTGGVDAARTGGLRDAPRAPTDSLLMVGASVTPDSGTVGDRLVLTLTVVHDFETAIAFPRVAGEIVPFEVIDVVIYPSDEGPGGVVERRDVVITVFETGEHTIPALAFYAVVAGGDTAVVYSESLSVTIRSVIPPEELTGDIKPRDIKPPLDLRRAVWPWILGSMLAAALVVGWRLWRRWRGSRSERPEDEGPTAAERRRAAHLGALERLRALRGSDHLTLGYVEPFYVELTDIVRRYVGERFGVPAIGRTTAELRPELDGAALGSGDIEWLTRLLERADLSKFARTAPAPAQGESDLDDVEGFVERTRLRDGEEGGYDAPLR